MRQPVDPPGLQSAVEGRVVGGHVGGADVHHPPVPFDRGQPPAGLAGPLQHPHRHPGIDQFTRTRQAGYTGSHHHDCHMFAL